MISSVSKDLAIVFDTNASGERYNALVRMAVQETLPGGLMIRANIYVALAQAEATYLAGVR